MKPKLNEGQLKNEIDAKRIIETPTEYKPINQKKPGSKKTRTKASVKKTLESLNKEPDNNSKIKGEAFIYWGQEPIGKLKKGK